MSWATIFAMLWEVFGPAIAAWIQQWLDSLLNRAALQLPPAASFASPGHAQVAAIAKAIELLPFFAFARCSLLRRMRATVAAHLEGSKVTADELDEIRGLSLAAEHE